MNNFSTPIPKARFSIQNLSHEFLTSMEMSDLVPIQCVELLPNDRLKCNTEAFIRFAPLQYPVLTRMNLKLFHFFVPNRIIWKYWEKFIAEDKLNNIGTSKRLKPFIDIKDVAATWNEQDQKNGYAPGSLCDFLGLPMAQFFSGEKRDGKFVNDLIPLSGIDEPIDALPFLAYQKIYNDWFRNENIDEDIFNTDTDDETIDQRVNLQNVVESEGQILPSFFQNLTVLRKKAWEKDYFTSALPTPQYGEPAKVSLSGDSTALLQYNNDLANSIVRDKTTGRVLGPIDALELSVSESGQLQWDNPYSGLQDVIIDNSGALEVDLSESQLSFTINDFRLAAAVQRYNEAVMRAGHRYIEYIKAMYNMITPDYRLQRPELLGASSSPVLINDITQTSETTEDSAQGQLAGVAYAHDKSNTVRYTAREHGFFFTIACVIPRTAYANGLNRMFSRFNRLDYHNRYFEELGDQEIRNKEIFLGERTEGEDVNQQTFGYQIRYSDYKFKPSTIHGEFTNNLDFFTLTRMFDERPELNSSFIRPDNETTNRAFAIRRGTDHLYSQFYNKLIIRRPMQDNPIPKII